MLDTNSEGTLERNIAMPLGGPKRFLFAVGRFLIVSLAEITIGSDTFSVGKSLHLYRNALLDQLTLRSRNETLLRLTRNK